MALAETVDVSPQAVNQWVHGKRPLPVAKATLIERATHGAVTVGELRPDLAAIFGATEKEPPTTNDEEAA